MMQQMQSVSKDTSIKVYIRVRPLLSSEIGQEQILSAAGDTLYFNNSSTSTLKQKFDKAFGEQSQQCEIFEEFKQQSKLVLDGYNFSVLAYGQTGSGKTYTMFGNDWENIVHSDRKDNPSKTQHQSTFLEDISDDKNNAGMIPRSIHNIFKLIEQSNKLEETQFHVYCSFLQIYNEKTYDLLVDNDQPIPLQLRESKLDGVFVEGLTEYAVNHYYDCIILMKRGEKNRFIRQTSMNAKSSRSHTIFQLTVESSKADKAGNLKKSKINLCDLAGSEKVKPHEMIDKVHFNELININQSLTTLGKVIQNLSQNSSRKKLLPIPYRESRLTRILQDSLGGNTQTYFIANVSGSVYQLQETYSTLKFAERAKNITIQVMPNKIDAVNSDLVKKLNIEINYLKTLLNMKRNGINTNDVHFNMAQLQEENNRLRINNVTVSEVEKLISDNREMKIEIQMLHQSQSASLQERSESKSEQNSELTRSISEKKFQPTSSQSDIKLKIIKPYTFTHISSPEKSSSESQYFTNEKPFSRLNKNSKNGNISQTFRNSGMMVLNEGSSIPKTEVNVRIKGGNSQYSVRKGYVEQSDNQYKQEVNLKNEKRRVLKRLNDLDVMKKENQERLEQDLLQIKYRSRSQNYIDFDKYELKEKSKLQLFKNKLKIIENDLILY